MCFGLELRLLLSDESSSLDVLECLSLPIPLVGILMALAGPGDPCRELEDDSDTLLVCL